MTKNKIQPERVTKTSTPGAKFLLTLFLLTLLTLPLCIKLVAAIPVSVTGLDPGASSKRDLSSLNATYVAAQGGNITRVDIESITITDSWQGYYGNISGNIVLQDADNYSLYEWSNASTLNGEIFATRNESIDWTSVNCSNATVISAEETYLGQVAGDGDSVTRTFNETDHPSFLVGTRNMTGCPSTNTFVNSAYQTSEFHMIMLADDQGIVAYTTIIDQDTQGYNTETHDFQMMVAENEKAGNKGTTNYYFYTELG